MTSQIAEKLDKLTAAENTPFITNSYRQIPLHKLLDIRSNY